jgi:DNA-binding transcriptional MocR family regulator
MQAFLGQQSFDRHLRALRHALQRQQASALRVIAAHFPTGTRVTRPEGGYFLWVELPETVDTLELHRLALLQGVGVAPGQLFSCDQRYRHHLRINHGHPGDRRFEPALRLLGELAQRLVTCSKLPVSTEV